MDAVLRFWYVPFWRFGMFSYTHMLAFELEVLGFMLLAQVCRYKYPEYGMSFENENIGNP